MLRGGHLQTNMLDFDSTSPRGKIQYEDKLIAMGSYKRNQGALAPQQPFEDRVLGVESILRLIEDETSRSVEDFGGDLFAPMSGEAMHHVGIR